MMFVSALLLAGCVDNPHSALSPAGEAAEEIARVTWLMIIGTLLLMVVMSLLGLHAVYRRARRPVPVSARLIILVGGVIVPSVVVLALLIYGVRAGHGMLPLGGDPLVIRVTGHQWWWRFEYTGPEGQTLYTANELHLPLDRAVDIHVATADVIHAFWVPVLGGKIDAMPGRTNVIRLRATRSGVFRGHCAEFCGAQHAHMAFHVEVHEAAGFEAWLDYLAGLDRAAGPEPGRTLFNTHCASCHSMNTAHDAVAPNLASLPRRPWLGAGRLRNTDEGLRLWLARHQELKPGTHKPAHDHLHEDSIDALARFLEAP